MHLLYLFSLSGYKLSKHVSNSRSIGNIVARQCDPAGLSRQVDWQTSLKHAGR